MIGKYDHELKIGTVTKRLSLAKDEMGVKMYNVTEDIPQYQEDLVFQQSDWIGGFGKFDFEIPDIYFEGQSIDTTLDGRVIVGPEVVEVKESDDSNLASAPVDFLWYEATGELICATGGASGEIYVYGTKWTVCNTSAHEVTKLEEYNQIAYAACGASNAYVTTSDADDWAATDLTDDKAQGFLCSPNPAGTSNVLWKWKQPNEIAETTNGQASGTAWSSPAYIGDTSDNITQVFLANDNILIGREDGLFHYDSDGGVHPLMDDLRHNRSSYNFKHVVQYQSSTYFILGTGIGEITPYNSFDKVGPLHGIDDIGKAGQVVALASDLDWLYVAVDEGTNTIIYKGREVAKQGELKWEFCPFIFLGTKTCACMKVVQHSATDRRLWFGYSNTTAYAKLFDNPTADSNARFITGNTPFLRMSYTYGSDRYWDKLYQYVITETKGCNATQNVIPRYRKDTETTANALTAAITTNGTVQTYLTTAINCKRIQFQLNLATASNAVTPEVLLFQAHGIEKPKTTRIHECVYALGDKPTRRTKTIRDFLRDGRTSVSLIKFADLRYGQKTTGTSSGDYVWVVMMPGYPKEIEEYHGKKLQPKLALQCRFREVDFTIS